MLLVEFNDNWADEFDVEGWFVAEEEVWEKFIQALYDSPQKLDSGFELYFGTNEGIEYRNIKEYLKHFSVRTITDEQAKVLIDLFNAQLTEERGVHKGEAWICYDLHTAYGVVLNPLD